jgi:hypothetical protein
MESGNGREGKEKKVKDNENKIDEHAGEDNWGGEREDDEDKSVAYMKQKWW